MPPLRAVHPHVRGDYCSREPRRGRCGGPSPRAWGLRMRSHGGRASTRSIPTCVGTTPGEQPGAPPGAVHPHVRGDYGLLAHPSAMSARSIPTCVGTTHDQDGKNILLPPFMCLSGSYNRQPFQVPQPPGRDGGYPHHSTPSAVRKPDRRNQSGARWAKFPPLEPPKWPPRPGGGKVGYRWERVEICGECVVYSERKASLG